MFSEKKVELTEGEKLFLDSIYDLILNPEITEEERDVLISAKTDLEKTGFLPRVMNQLMLAFRGNAINRTLTKPVQTFMLICTIPQVLWRILVEHPAYPLL